MKKLIVSILLLFMMAFPLAGCGGQDSGSISQENIKQYQKADQAESKPDSQTAGNKDVLEQESRTDPDKSKEISLNEDEKADRGPKAENNDENKDSVPENQEVTLPASNTDEKSVLENRLMVSRDFGTESIFDKKILFQKNDTVMDLIKRNLEVSTGYDGGFINSINGLKTYNGGISGQRMDWFYYVNGICSNLGAADYEVQAGDVVWWDYHPWSMGPANSSVIGLYPEPFQNGYRGKSGPVAIMYADKYQSSAEKLKKALTTVGSEVKVLALNEEELSDRKGPVILIAEWNSVNDIKYLAGLNKASYKNGTSVHFSEEGIEVLDYQGKAARTEKGSIAVITSTGEGLGDPNPLWLIVGSDETSIGQALDILINSPKQISGYYSAAIISGELLRLPLQ